MLELLTSVDGILVCVRLGQTTRALAAKSRTGATPWSSYRPRGREWLSDVEHSLDHTAQRYDPVMS